MKKLFLLGVLTLAGLMNAQTAKGSWVISGDTNLGFTSKSSKTEVDGKSFGDKDTTSAFKVGTEVGYFVMDNLAIGVDAALTSTTIKSGDYKSTGNLYTIAPSATYYFGTTEVRPYLGASIGYGGMKEEKESIGGLTWGVKGGLVYLVSKNVGINLDLGYNQVNYTKDKLTQKNNTFGVNGGLSIFL